MTEDEWFASVDPAAMQAHIRSRGVPLRPFQLFVVACGGTIRNEMTFEAREAFDALSRAVEGTANRKHRKQLDEWGPIEEWLAWVLGTSGHARTVYEASAALARDIFGNPFRPVHFPWLWRTDTAVLLARQMYDSRDFSAMPVLADALQDAGCDSDDILNHCRATQQTHVRGCWVVDLVLGKS